MTNHTRMVFFAGLVGMLGVIWLLSSVPQGSSSPAASAPEPPKPPRLGSLEKGSTLATMRPWTTAEVANRTSLLRTDGGTRLVKGDRCWISKDSRLEVLTTSEDVDSPYSGYEGWVLAVIREKGGRPNPFGEGCTCPVGTVFFLDGPIAKQSAQYAAWLVGHEKEKCKREAEAAKAIEEFERKNR